MFVLLLWYYGVWNRGLLSIFFCVTLPHMSIRAGVVVAVALQQIDCAPDTEASTEGDHKGLEDLNCTIEKSHIQNLAGSRSKECPDHYPHFRLSFQNYFLKVAVFSWCLLYDKTALSGGSGRIGQIDLIAVVGFVRPQFQLGRQEFLNVKGIAWVSVRKVLIVGMLGDVVLGRQERAHTA